MDRRGFLTAILAAGMAPAVVRAASLMPIRGYTLDEGSGLLLTKYSLSEQVTEFLREEVEPVAERMLVAYQFGRPLQSDLLYEDTLYTATRYERLPLPLEFE